MSRSESGKGGRPRYVLPARDPKASTAWTAGLPSISIALRALLRAADSYLATPISFPAAFGAGPGGTETGSRLVLPRSDRNGTETGTQFSFASK